MTYPLHDLIFAAFSRDEASGARNPSRRSEARERADATGLDTATLPDDVELVERIRAGDRLLFERMYGAHYAALRRLAAHLTTSADVADDVIQDVFAALWMRRATWAVTTTVRAYLAGAVHRAIQHLGRHAGVVRRATDLWSAADASPGLGSSPAQPDEQAETRDLVDIMVRAIRALPPRRQAAILLRWREGMNTTEIADALGISDRVARKLLAAAESSLRAVFDRLR